METQVSGRRLFWCVWSVLTVVIVVVTWNVFTAMG
jgi:hypothetical protein